MNIYLFRWKDLFFRSLLINLLNCMTFLLKKSIKTRNYLGKCWLTLAGWWCICWQVPAGYRYSLADRSKVMGKKKLEMEQRCVSNRPSEHHGGLQRASTPCCSFTISKQQYYTLFLSNTNTFIFNIYFRVYSGIQDKNLSVIFLYSKDRNDKNCSLSRAKVELS